MKNVGSIGSSGRLSLDYHDDEEISKMAISAFQAREEEIERKKTQVKEKVEYQLTRAEEESKRLAQIWEELEGIEALAEPTRKEVASLRKRIDVANREIKSLGQSCQKKEREYKEALEALHMKNTERAQLATTLTELVNQSEKLRMKKLEDLSKILDPTS